MHPYEGSFSGIGGLTFTTNVTLDDFINDAIETWLSRWGRLTNRRDNPFRSEAK